MIVSNFSLISRRALAFASLAAAVAAGAACDRIALVAPSGSAITLIASPPTLLPTGEAELVAIVIEGGSFTTGTPGPGGGTTSSGTGTPVHDGTRVYFSTTIGRVEPAEAETDDGRAVVRLIADGRTGTAVVTAYSGPAITTLDIVIGSAGGSTAAR